MQKFKKQINKKTGISIYETKFKILKKSIFESIQIPFKFDHRFIYFIKKIKFKIFVRSLLRNIKKNNILLPKKINIQLVKK